MRLSKIYSNKPSIFEPITFNPGLNVIIGEIRRPENKDKDTHNLGKTTLGRLIDFCLLERKDAKFFLFRRSEIFNDFTFYLEVFLSENRYLTIKRSVGEATKISFKLHMNGNANHINLPDSEWDHLNVAFDRSKELLEGLLGFSAAKPYDFRKVFGYLLRNQDDYGDVFHLRKYIGSHSNWKPYLAHILGFNSSIIETHYHKESELDRIRQKEQTLNTELGGSIQDLSKVDGLILLRQSEIDKKQKILDAFDFNPPEKEKLNALVEDIDARTAELNIARYTATHAQRKISKSLEDEMIKFSTEEAHILFKEVNVLFEGQLKKDFDQLIKFNKAIANERKEFLKEELKEISRELKAIELELEGLSKKRSDHLAFLSKTGSFDKYKTLSSELVTYRAEIAVLNQRREMLHKLQLLRKDIRSLEDDIKILQTEIENDVENKSSDDKSIYSKIRLNFSEIIQEVINQQALLDVSPNNNGHLDFETEILDATGKPTSADEGRTYKKLLCIAFDMSVLRAYAKKSFPRFVFHDGVFESLDDRKKEKLLTVIRDYSNYGVQQIITLIDSETPRRETDEPVFKSNEIILTLHDEGISGLLFKMHPW